MSRPHKDRANTSRPRRTAATLAVFACALLILAPAAAAAGEEVIADCNANNGLTGNYTPAQLNSALQSLPTDVDEYSDCRAIIRAALSQGVRKTVKPPAILASKASNKRQLAKIKQGIEKELDDKADSGDAKVAGTVIVPGTGRTLSSAAEPGMPWSMAIALLGIALIGVAELGGRIRGGLRKGGPGR
jgi:hypothetical protein